MCKATKNVGVMATRIALIACAVATAGHAADAAGSQKLKAHAEKSSVRLSRPAQSRDAKPASGIKLELKANAFDLSADAANLNRSAAELDRWAAKSEPQTSANATRSATPAAPSNPPATVTVDYTAIEQAYRDAIPKPTVASGTVAAPSTAAIGVPVGLIGPVIANRAPGAQYVDTDNCACGTPIPTSNCMLNRQLNPSNPQNGLMVQPPQMRTGTAPGVFQRLGVGR